MPKYSGGWRVLKHWYMCSLTIEIYNYFNLLFQIYWCVEPQWDIKLMHRDRYWFETPINWKWFPLLICDHLKILNMNFSLYIYILLNSLSKHPFIIFNQYHFSCTNIKNSKQVQYIYTCTFKIQEGDAGLCVATVDEMLLLYCVRFVLQSVIKQKTQWQHFHWPTLGLAAGL